MRVRRWGLLGDALLQLILGQSDGAQRAVRAQPPQWLTLASPAPRLSKLGIQMRDRGGRCAGFRHSGRGGAAGGESEIARTSAA